MDKVFKKENWYLSSNYFLVDKVDCISLFSNKINIQNKVSDWDFWEAYEIIERIILWNWIVKISES